MFLAIKRRSIFSSAWMENGVAGGEKKIVVHQYICEWGVKL